MTTGNNDDPPEAFLMTCARCHGERATGDTGPPLVGITRRPRRSQEDLLKMLDNPRAYNLEEHMPASFPKLTKDDKQKIVAWIAGLKAAKE